MTPDVSRTPQIAILDAAYGNDVAAGGGVLIPEFAADHPAVTWQIRLPLHSADYEPGAFYKRELPVLLELLRVAASPLRAVVVDGYVHLDRDGRPGLGAHLAAALHHAVPVIGVAKTPFRGDDWSRAVLRGESRQPLRVTAIGMDADAAADAVRSMSGPHRIPAMCKLADRLARAALDGADQSSVSMP